MKNRALEHTTDFEKALDIMFRRLFPQYHSYFKIVTMKRSINSETQFGWAMATGKIPEIVDIYFLDDYICEVNEKMFPAQVETLVIYCLNQYKTGLETKAGLKI
jgi:hypothetical protein